jgi:coenzyme F420-reducing hydrogenase delta subunit
MVPSVPDILVYLCKNCIPEGGKLPAQWSESGLHVRVKEIPCSGKIDAQYILRSLEGGVRGVCVVTCPRGECTLSQGNYRAEIRVKTVQRLLSEIGDDPGRAELIQCPPDATIDGIKGLISGAVRRFTGKNEVGICK